MYISDYLFVIIYICIRPFILYLLISCLFWCKRYRITCFLFR